MRAAAVALLSLGCAFAGHAQDAPVPADAPASAPAAADKSSPVMVLAGSCARPEYPIASARAGRSGTTVIRVAVNDKGASTGMTVTASSGDARLDAAFRYALGACKFEAARHPAGFPIAGTLQLRHVWRLEDAKPDPWPKLRAAIRPGTWADTADLGAVEIVGESLTTADQRLKILRRVQEAARENAGCASIERIAPAALPPAWALPENAKSASGRPVRLAGELWNATQCGARMSYALLLRFPEGEPAEFVIVPL